MIKWKDKRDVYVISNIYNGLPLSYQKKGKLKCKPDMVYFYNLNKGGVDGLDQTLSYYSYERRTIKWWKKIFFYLFEVGISNCCIYYKLINACDSKYRNLDFRTALAQQLIDKYANLGVKEEKEFSHYPIQVECKGACKNEGCKKNRISYKCNECDVYLCNVPCFGEYHNS